MDEGLSKAVLKVFVDLYNKKLIYKDLKLTNWDIKLKTAISDLEVIQKETSGKLYYINYKFKNSEKTITIATTRPETMFGLWPRSFSVLFPNWPDPAAPLMK